MLLSGLFYGLKNWYIKFSYLPVTHFKTSKFWNGDIMASGHFHAQNLDWVLFLPIQCFYFSYSGWSLLLIFYMIIFYTYLQFSTLL